MSSLDARKTHLRYFPPTAVHDKRRGEPDQTTVDKAALLPSEGDEIRPGDVVWFPPGEKHWHGATRSTAMTHVAIQEALNGKTVDWMEHVTDEQYRK